MVIRDREPVLLSNVGKHLATELSGLFLKRLRFKQIERNTLQLNIVIKYQQL